MSLPENIVSRKLSAARRVGFGNNNVVGFSHGGKRYFAKTYKAEVCFERETYALENFRAAGIPVPSVAFKSASYGEAGDCLLVTERLAGSPLDEVERGRGRYCHEMGRLLSAIHALDIPEMIEPVVIPVDEIAGSVTDFAERHDIRHPLLAVMRETLEQLNRSGPVVLSHGDYISRHIFVCRGVVSGVVDWECLRAAPPELDLGHCSAFLEIFGRPGEEEQFAKGYGAGFDPEIKDRVKLYYKVVFARYWERLKREREYRQALRSIEAQPAHSPAGAG